MVRKINILLSFVSFIQFSIQAQELKIPKAPAGILVDLHYLAGVPVGILADRFGNHLGVGGGVSYIGAGKSIEIGVKYSYLFGSRVKEDVMSIFRTNYEGLLIGSDQFLAEMKLRERGFNTQIFFGGIIGKASAKARYGLKWQLGLGLLEHHIRFQDEARALTQFTTDLRKGLDRKTAGFSISPYVGYLFIQHQGHIAFAAGIEPVIAYTETLRSWNYDTNQSDDGKKRWDVMFNFKLCWYFPFFLKNSEEIEY